jgi:DNA-binding transcriptional MerR regulator
MAPTDHSITEVAALTGTPVRTIRYYLSEGLLPSPGKVGTAARYDEAFVARLRAIRRLQERHLPLAEIRKALESMPDESVIAAIEPVEEPPSGSASEYVRRLLGVGEERVVYPVPAAPPSTAPPPAAARAAASGILGPDAQHVASARFVSPDPAAPPAPAASTPVGLVQALGDVSSEPAVAARSHWERIAITPDIEIHIRRPLSRTASRRAERLVEAARDIFEQGA